MRNGKNVRAVMVAAGPSKRDGRHQRAKGDEVKISVRLTQDEYRALRVYAAANGLTGEEAVKEALRRIFKEKK